MVTNTNGEGVELDKQEVVYSYEPTMMKIRSFQHETAKLLLEVRWADCAAEQGHQQAIKYLRDVAGQGDKQAKEALCALGLDDE